MRLLRIEKAGLKGRYATLKLGQLIEEDRLAEAGHDVAALLKSGAVVVAPAEGEAVPVKSAPVVDRHGFPRPAESTPPTTPVFDKTVPLAEGVPAEDLVEIVTYLPAVSLAKAGYDTLAKARAASDDELLATKGVGQSTLDKLRNVPRPPDPRTREGRALKARESES